MLCCNRFFELLKEFGVAFFAGVPDSVLKHLCSCITERASAGTHIIAANEGGAVALAAGHFLATGELSLVYMQNSGLGNAINPLVSLADTSVYAIPMVLMIGWRGEPDTTDESQHVKQGQATIPLLDTLSIPRLVLSNQIEEAKSEIELAVTTARRENTPFAIVVRKGTFEQHKSPYKKSAASEMTRVQTIETIVGLTEPTEIVVSTTGKTSRELFEVRQRTGSIGALDFLNIGSMGHASQIAMGIALGAKNRRVFCLDGDGALIMHMGAVAIIGTSQPRNLVHVVLNNGMHESVGGQPTAGLRIDVTAIAAACGYHIVRRVSSTGELRRVIEGIGRNDGPSLIEARITPGSLSDLGRPTTTPWQRREEFLRFLQQ